MSEFVTNYDANLVAPDTGAGPTAAIWKDCPIIQMQSDPSIGYYIFDDFINAPDHLTNVAAGAAQVGKYSIFTSNSSVIGNVAEEGGAVFLNSAANELAAVLRAGGAAFNVASGSKKLWFEARIKAGSIANAQNGFFVGLYEDVAMTATVPIAADGTLATEVFAGFHRLEADGDKLDVVHCDGSTATTLQADATTLVAGTYVKVGMVFEGDTITFYENGSSVATLAVGATEYPDATTMNPVIAILGAATEATGVTMDWWRVAQLR